jgi:hypothetical protein
MNVVRLRALPVLVLAGALIAGCGGSVADLDRPRQSQAASAPDTPFCAAVQRSGEALVPVTQIAARGSADPQELADAVTAVRQANTQVTATAPQDIRPDVDTYVRVIGLQLDALVAAGGNGQALSRDTELSAQINAPEATAANSRVSQYIQDNCSPNPGRG